MRVERASRLSIDVAETAAWLLSASADSLYGRQRARAFATINRRRRRRVATKFRRSSRPASSSSSDTGGSLDGRRCSRSRAPHGAARSGHYFAPGRPPPGHVPRLPLYWNL